MPREVVLKRVPRLALFVALVSGLALAPLGLRGRKLNGPLDTLSVVGDVDEFQVSPDGVRVVYLADQDTPGVIELYSARRDGTGTPVRLSGPLVAQGDVDSFQITPDGARVVYRADQDTDLLYELYSAPIDGSAPAVKLNGTLVAGGQVIDYEPYVMTSDGQTMLYVADQDVDNEQHLYRVPTDGSAPPVAIATPSFAGGDVFGHAIAPDDTTVLLVGTLRAAGFAELFKVPLNGSSAPMLMHPPLVYGDVQSFDVSPDGAWVVYRSDDNTSLETEVFSVPFDLSAPPVKLSGPLASSLSDVDEFAISPNSTHVIYRGDQDLYGVEELYSAPIDGSAPAVKVSAPQTFGYAILLFPREASFTADGTTLVYKSYPGGSYNQIYATPVDGSAPATLLSLMNGAVSKVGITSDGARVVFTGTQPGAGSANQLYSVPIDGSAAATRLNDPVPDQARVADFLTTADSSTVVYYSGSSSSLQPNLHAVAVDGSTAPIALAAGLPWADIDQIALDSASGTALYRGDTDTPGTDEVFAVPVSGLAPPQRVSGDLPGVPGSGEVQSFTLAPDGHWAVYIDPLGVHGVNVWTGEPAKLLSPPELSGASPTSLSFSDEVLFSPDGESVFFSVGIGQLQLLYRAPLAGDEDATLLHLLEGDAFNRFFNLRITPDGEHLVYRYYIFDYFGPPNYGAVYSVATDGSSAPVHLGGGISSAGLELALDGIQAVFPVGGVDYYGYLDHALLTAPSDGSGATTELFVNDPVHYTADLQLAADGTRVVYRTFNDTTFVTELWSSTVDGTTHTLLADGFPGSSSTRRTHIRVSPVDTFVAYVRAGPTDYELYHGPVDGSAPATLLASVPLTQRVDDILFSPDGSRLVFLADGDVAGQFELFSVPSGGGQAPVRVNDPFVTGGDVSYPPAYPVQPRHFQITPDGSTVVYRADARVDGIYELFAAPITGGGPAIMLHNPLSPGFQIYPDFQLLSDSKHVLYRGQPNATQLAVWLARLDGTGGYRRLTDQVLEPYTVESGFQLTPDERHVVYRADMDETGTTELYAFPLKAGARRAPVPNITVEQSAD
jgi:Tol biopolymer transport system component